MAKDDLVGMVDMVDMVDNMAMVDNVNIVDSIDMVTTQKTYGYLYLLVDTSGCKSWTCFCVNRLINFYCFSERGFGRL